MCVCVCVCVCVEQLVKCKKTKKCANSDLFVLSGAGQQSLNMLANSWLFKNQVGIR